MFKRFFIFLATLLIFAVPVLGAETLTKDNFAEPEIKVNNKTYVPNETTLVLNENEYVWISYIIEPKTDDDATKIDERNYDISTELSDASMKYRIVFKNGASISKSGFTISVPDADDLDGVDMIEINLTGYTPTIDVRLKEITALKIRVQDGGYILPAVIIYVKDDGKFTADLENAKSKYNELKDFLANYMGKADVTTLRNYLDMVGDNLTLAEENLNEKDYINANKRLSNAEFWLEKAEEEKVAVEAKYLFSLADKRIKDIGENINKIDVYIEEIEKKELVNTSVLIDYKTRYSSLKSVFDDITTDLAVANGYISAGSYEDAKAKLENILSKLDEIESEVNGLLSELSSLVTVITTTTQESSEGSPQIELPEIELPKIDWKIVGFYGGIVAGAIVVVALAVIGLKKYMKRRRWDELK
ncbi:hypothetical protein [Archaeoglobus profundus]|uniref:Uncharacterized protein n=1 Tax=Archaeoglobus profundus (strain DSM 5631 / JCM 9629 / NBRC 100127 / Av18) TaxID=572546 RepID=D2REC1_ARCPA|nr:hypothetical protein [Archaeoglobus profundus]ADB58465.1 hypothetical protein Arcpr_1417 [Archaeoglobus profundus DSM 5631]